MRKHINTLLALSVLYVIIYAINLLFIVANYSALLIGRDPSLSFASQLNFAAWGFPLTMIITCAAFLVDAGYFPKYKNNEKSNH